MRGSDELPCQHLGRRVKVLTARLAALLNVS
jgi:hypothetical protein